MKIAVIGFGASGLFAALALKDSKYDIDIFDIGPSFEERKPCPISLGKLEKCPPNGCAYCSIFSSGGIFNDGKIISNASEVIGGELYSLIGKEKLQEYISYVVSEFQKAGAINQILKPNEDDVKWIKSKATLAGMSFAYQELLHIGSDRLPIVVNTLFEPIKDRFNMHWNTRINHIEKIRTGRTEYKFATDQGTYDKIIISTGRSGSRWLTETNIFKQFKTEPGRVDVGIRLETSNEVMQTLNEKFYETKLYYRSPTFGDITRSFCTNPSGFVCTENNGEFSIVNGHAKHDVKSSNTNFAILVSKTFTEPFKSPVKYGNAVASLANMLGGGPLVQRLGDLKRGRRTKKLQFNSITPSLKVEPGDLSLALPYRILVSILEYIEAMNKVAPGISYDDTLLYGVEAKYFTDKIHVSENMEAYPGCYVIGDISGWTRGISQSCVSGIIAAKHLNN